MYFKSLLFVISLTCFSLASASNNPPERTLYDDWFTLCDTAKNFCSANQLQYMVKDTERSQVLHAHLSKNQNNQLFMQIILPLGVLLKPGIIMKIDDGKQFSVAYHTCTNKGCIAVIPATESLLKELRLGSKALLGFRPVGIDKTMVIEMSLKGFTKASKQVQSSNKLTQ